MHVKKTNFMGYLIMIPSSFNLQANDLQRYLRDDDQSWAKSLLDVSILTDRAKEHLYPDRLFPRMGVMTIYGMAGAGKTKLMKKLFQHPSVLHRFDLCAWINIGSKYKSENILVDTLAQLYPHIDRENISGDAELAADLCAQLSYKKCLIVLDDLWRQEPVHLLNKFLPNIKGELMVTTRLMKVALFGPCDRAMKLRLMNKDESWDLLREKVFSEDLCPDELEIVGKKIAEKCEGLPLLIIAVAKHLSMYEKTLEFWNRVVENRASVFMDAQRDISKTLLPSYEFLPQHLKSCFLYLGVFTQGYEVSASKLKNLWFVEGFLEPNPSQTLEACATRCLKELVDRTVVLVRQTASDLITNKSCALHFVFWHLSCDLAMKNKFFHALTSYIDDDSTESTHRRLCIRYNSLLGFKEVCDAISSMSALRSLLCTGPPHQYPVPLSFESRLLKVLEALAIRFYEFPIQVVKLVQLRYLALTCNGELPSSISKLWNLQFLIVTDYLTIKSSRNSPYLPKEIWEMKELKHLEVSGRMLPDPDSEALLPNLLTLLEVSVHSCTKKVLKRIPNLKKLGIQIELEPNMKSNPFHNLNRISRLRKLESLKCVVVNPSLGPEVVFSPPDPRSMFPPRLKKLILSGLGFPWEYMRRIGKLKNLEVLKLRSYAFRGPAWKIKFEEFDQLKFLSFEDTDLVRWDLPFNKELRFLSIKHCYRLQQLKYFMTVRIEKIEVVNSHPLAVAWAEKMKETNWMRKMETLEIDVQSSWRT